MNEWAVDRITAIENAAFANITWEDSGLKSERVRCRDLEHATEDQ